MFPEMSVARAVIANPKRGEAHDSAGGIQLHQIRPRIGARCVVGARRDRKAAIRSAAHHDVARGG
jgi:hypothetical protein